MWFWWWSWSGWQRTWPSTSWTNQISPDIYKPSIRSCSGGNLNRPAHCRVSIIQAVAPKYHCDQFFGCWKFIRSILWFEISGNYLIWLLQATEKCLQTCHLVELAIWAIFLLIETDKMEVPLRGILFSEFHLTAGPKVSFMAPENFMEKEVFDAVSSYIIPKPELKDRLITITTRDYKIVGCPVCMEVWHMDFS